MVIRIFAEIGEGQKVSLAKLSIEKLEQTGRPFRLAIDFAIWQFQMQSGRGKSDYEY
jgi:Holliday junction resolvase YEN1